VKKNKTDEYLKDVLFRLFLKENTVDECIVMINKYKEKIFDLDDIENTFKVLESLNDMINKNKIINNLITAIKK
jgi:hypothetical protein